MRRLISTQSPLSDSSATAESTLRESSCQGHKSYFLDSQTIFIDYRYSYRLLLETMATTNSSSVYYTILYIGLKHKNDIKRVILFFEFSVFEKRIVLAKRWIKVYLVEKKLIVYLLPSRRSYLKNRWKQR